LTLAVCTGVAAGATVVSLAAVAAGAVGATVMTNEAGAALSLPGTGVTVSENAEPFCGARAATAAPVFSAVRALDPDQ
jgi:hypothetical protein